MNGFQSPNYTQTPNDLFDELLPAMGLAELKVVMCIVRHTFGFHKDEANLSIRKIARFTGLTAKSVMEGAKQAEDHGLITRRMDGNKTTLWNAVVSVIPTTTRRDTKYHTSVIPSNTQVVVKETNKREKKGDILDGMLAFGKQGQEQGVEKVEEIVTKLEEGLRLNFPRGTKDQSIYRRILNTGKPVERFIEWVKSEERRLSFAFLYAKDTSALWRDFPQAFGVEPTSEKQGAFYG